MSDIDAQIEYYYSLHPNGFHDLQHLIVRQLSDEGIHSVSVEVCLRSQHTEDEKRLTLLFGGVSNLRLIPPATSVLYFSDIRIVSIRDMKWEGVNYRVFAAEQDSDFSFICRDFAAYLT